MKKDVTIEIYSTQAYQDTDPDEITLKTEGAFYEKNGKFYIKYDESEMTGVPNTKTTLKIDDDIVTLMRTGEMETQMIFKKGEHHIGLYQTVAGPYTLGVKTKELSHSIDEFGGNLYLEYEIELNYQMSGYNTFDIKVKTSEENENELHWYL